MRPSGICTDLHLKLCALFNESLSLEERLRSGQEFCENLENAAGEKEIHDLTHNVYEKIQRFMTSTEPQNLQESPLQQLRRMCLEIFQKMPNGDHLRPYARLILALLFKLVEVENEENVLLCVKLIIELHKYYRPSFSLDVTSFLSFVRRVYRGLQHEIENIFEPQCSLEVPSIIDLDVNTTALKTFTITTVYTQEQKDDGSVATVRGIFI
ncbi:hypothetical protein EG68_10469 [Paragonimus skrjabini miyazakii]|uniref:Uncharacterized protein n=1 Tax=Paragonimus skrjabini miyazakii TaxID=59628 RepID=A0A8S9YBF4_9TREM|nr:hypothetical protein EG68_10469 [Paragonimus skrjabini miyazakii]